MIVDERMRTFIHSLETENSEILETIEKEALDTFVPIIRKEMQSFLKVKQIKLMNIILRIMILIIA